MTHRRHTRLLLVSLGLGLIPIIACTGSHESVRERGKEAADKLNIEKKEDGSLRSVWKF